MTCHGLCTLETQITWLYDIEGIRGINPIIMVNNGTWEKYLSDAVLAAIGFSYKDNSSWNWGNVTFDELSKYQVVIQIFYPYYPGKPYFIVHK